ncbi:hypothetical protein STRDD11_00548 [Streptococcus sp. DD11]|nr:hypothetical protein STRDD11_00548 [Streptococcus sp. DD11]
MPLTLTKVGEFSLIYLVIFFYYTDYQKIQKINQGLSRKA